ncbi:hypothetical protein [Caproiciproducens galactitolivorans]|uniref:Uncharacterized protein n=1 Tax=Caproiciproducens galactitolivorans TaxID=642589 RepID=A0ABT4BYA7_9FIRM|nr:hypothetical protein [Caproiciproducens galactitolivorans]MCY1715315.1 hypothetical protein [Caproiciproducens galactitolivorans]
MYVKITVDDEFATQDIEIELNAHNIYAKCPKCGKEFQVDPIEWAHDFPEFNWGHRPFCDECSNRKSSLTARCTRCGHIWNISAKKVIPKSGFLCWDCSYRDKLIKKGILKGGKENG